MQECSFTIVFKHENFLFRQLFNLLPRRKHPAIQTISSITTSSIYFTNQLRLKSFHSWLLPLLCSSSALVHKRTIRQKLKLKTLIFSHFLQTLPRITAVRFKQLQWHLTLYKLSMEPSYWKIYQQNKSMAFSRQRPLQVSKFFIPSNNLTLFHAHICILNVAYRTNFKLMCTPMCKCASCSVVETRKRSKHPQQTSTAHILLFLKIIRLASEMLPKSRRPLNISSHPICLSFCPLHSIQ